MIVSHLLLILHKKYSFISLCLKPEMWQKVAKFKGAAYFHKALYVHTYSICHVHTIFKDNLLYVLVISVHYGQRGGGWCYDQGKALHCYCNMLLLVLEEVYSLLLI
jgi:hypothetical protein